MVFEGKSCELLQANLNRVPTNKVTVLKVKVVERKLYLDFRIFI